jgi:CheY-like chemotaxis protein
VGARSGEEGIALARQLRPKIITLDIMMSHMDGWSVLQTFKSDPILKSIPVYIVSVIDNKALAYSLGVTGYILKPFDRDELLRTLQVVSKETAQQILVVDDDADVRRFFSESLSQDGYDVETVGTGEEAMSRMKQLKPDILFLDLVLPAMSGFDVLEAMEQLPTKGLPAIFVMAEKELTPQQQGYLDRRVQMILKKHAEGFAELLPVLKKKLTSIRKAAA